MSRSAFPIRALPWLVALPLSLAFANFISVPVVYAAPPAAALKAEVPQTEAMQLVVAQGVVRDAKGKPIKGATVVVSDVGFDDDPTRFQTTPVQTDGAGRFIVEAHFSSAGLSNLRRRLRLPDPDLRLLVGIYAPGFALIQQQVKAADQRSPTLPPNDCVVQRGFSATGQVSDENGKPLAGAKVQSSIISTEEDRPNSLESFIRLTSFKGSAIERHFQTVSDTAGRFTLRDLPLGTLTVALTDSRYVQQSVRLIVSKQPVIATTAATLTARPAARVRGRVLSPDGTSVGKVAVQVRSTLGTNTSTGNAVSANALTASDGTFSVGGIEAGTVIVSVKAPSSDWAGNSTPALQIKAGEETNTGDIVLSKGILLTGYVREEESKAPIAGVLVMVTATDGGSASAATDGQGRYQIRTQAGSNAFSLGTPPSDYVASSKLTSMKVGEESHTAPDFFLRRGLTLTGTARDEKGQPATGAMFYLVNSYGHFATTIVDTQGNWTLRGIDPFFVPGDIFVGIPRFKVEGSWMLHDEPRVTFPSPPLALTLYPLTLQDVKVKVITPEGKRVAGATVRYKLFLDNTRQDDWVNKEVVSNDQGEVTLPAMRPEQSAELTATKQGYTLTQNGKVARFGGLIGKTSIGLSDWLHTTDIVMAPLDAKVTGRVVDAQGQPAAGARVALLFPNDLRDLPDGSVLTDAQGRFTLAGLPQAEITIGAAKGRAFAQMTLKAKGTAELKLGEVPPLPIPHDTTTAFSQLERAAQALRDNDELAGYTLSQVVGVLARYDVERTQRALTGAGGKINESFLTSAPLSLARSDPRRALSWSKVLFPLIRDNTTRTEMKLYLATLTATVDPVGARQVYDEVAPKVASTNNSEEFGIDYARLAALALALKDPVAEKWLNALNRCIPSLSASLTDNAYYLDLWPSTLANGDLTAARKWVAQLPLDYQVTALSALASGAASRDLPAARQMLTEAETLMLRPDFPVEPVRNDERVRTPVAFSLNKARLKVVRALMNTDLKAARELARQLSTDTSSSSSFRNEIQALAAEANDAEAMRGLLRAARESGPYSAGTMARLAALMSDALPQVSASGFRDARDKLAHRPAYGQDGEPATFYAYAREPFDPAASRLLLENVWLRTMDTLKQAQAKGDKGQQNMQQISSNLADVTRAMIPLDLARANAMLDFSTTINGKDGQYYDAIARTQIIRWLLADGQVRRAMPLNLFEQLNL